MKICEVTNILVEKTEIIFPRRYKVALIVRDDVSSAKPSSNTQDQIASEQFWIPLMKPKTKTTVYERSCTCECVIEYVNEKGRNANEIRKKMKLENWGNTGMSRNGCNTVRLFSIRCIFLQRKMHDYK